MYGMPYVTMVYEDRKGKGNNGSTMLPTITSMIPLGIPPRIDGTIDLVCSASKPETKIVDHKLELCFPQSDYSWLVVFSESVLVQCIANDETGHTFLQVV
jgi:hypothetical protein